MIDVRKLRMLAALDRLGTLAAVADELRLTAPGVSMQLSALERELGVALTERQGRRLALTPAGKLLAAHGRELVERLSLAELEVAALRLGEVGSYRVAAFPSAARTFIADAWRQLLAEAAGVSLSLSTPEPEDALAGLTAGEADLAVVHSYSNVPRDIAAGVELHAIATEPVWLAMRADDALAGSAVDLAELANRPWITPTPDLTCFEMTERACGLAGFRPRIVAQSMDFAVQLELVAAGVGVALVPDLTVAALPRDVVLVPPAQALHRHIHAAQRSSTHGDPGLVRLIGAFRGAATRHIRQGTPLPDQQTPLPD